MKTSVMLNKFLHPVKSRKVKPIRRAYKLVFKGDILRQIMQIKGWRNLSEVAKETGYTRQYISMIDRGTVNITVDFLARIFELTGNINNCKCFDKWFEFIPCGEYNPNHQMWAMAKYEGRKPYQRYSISADFRKSDYEVEEEK